MAASNDRFPTDPPLFRSVQFRLAQEGGGGGDGGGAPSGGSAPGSGPGGDAFGGGPPDTGAGGDSLGVGPEGSGTPNPGAGTGSFGPEEDLSGAHTCPTCGDRCYSFSAANSTYWNCARCGWSSYPRKKKRDEGDRISSVGNEILAARGRNCYLCKEEVPVGSRNYFDASGLPTHLVCPKDQDQDLCYDCNGGGTIDSGRKCPSCKGSGISGNPGGESLQDAQDVKRQQLWKDLGLSFGSKVSSVDYERCGNCKGAGCDLCHQSGVYLDQAEPETDDYPFDGDPDGVSSRDCYLGNHSTCRDELCGCNHHDIRHQYSGACADGDHAACRMGGCPDACHKQGSKVAADPLGTNVEWKGDIRGPAVTQDPEAAEEWGACQYDDGHTAVTDFLGKKVCNDHLRYALEDAPNALDKATEGVKTTTGVDRLNFQNAVQKIKKDISRGEKTLREVQLKKDLKDRGVSVASTQEKKVMDYKCDKCGVQATHESVTRTGGRGLLCAEHADSFKLANDAAGIVAKVFPLHKGRNSALGDKECPGCTGSGNITITYNDGTPDLSLPCPNCGGKGNLNLKDRAVDKVWDMVNKKSSEAEKVAAVSCVDCDGDGTCDQCGGVGCNACDASGNCITCKGDGYQTGPNDESPGAWQHDLFERLNSPKRGNVEPLPAWITAATSCPACGTSGLVRTADTVEADPDDEDDAHTHTEAPATSGEGAPPGKWDELHANHPWAQVSQCPGCGQGHVTCTHPYHGDEAPAFKLPQSPSDVWDPQDAKFKENENTGESGFVPERIEVPPQGMEDLPKTKKKVKDLEGKGLVYHQTVKEQGAPDDTQARRFVHEDRATAEVAHQRALDAGFDSELEPVMRRKVDRDSDFHTLNGRPTMGQVMNIGDDPYAPKGDVPTQLQGDCVRCGKETYVGDSSDFGDALGKGTVSCASCAPLVGANLDTYKSASREEILAYLYEEDPAEWAKVAQNIGCPNCEGQGSTPDGKVCAACFGTGSGGGVMLKGGSADMPEEASFGVLFGDDGQMYRTLDGDNWEVMAATEHDESEEEEDDDIKLFKFDHGPGEGNDAAHSEIHQQEHVSSWSAVRLVEAAAGEMTGTGCGRCGRAGHTSEGCPSNKGHNMTENSDERHLDYSDFQPKGASVADKVLQGVLEDDPGVISDTPFDKDAALMEDPYELEDERLILDPFEAAKPRKKPKTKEEKAEEKKRKAKEKADKVEDGADKAADAVHWLTTPGGKHGQVNPGSGPAGTSVDDLTDDVGSGEHPVPVTFITDHKGEVTQGVDTAVCRQCGKEMSDHAQWNPTHQVGNPPKQASSLNWEEIGWMDDTILPDTRPVRGSFDRDAHSPTYDVSLHDPQSPRVGTPCQFCGTGGAPNLGAVKAFSDPVDPVSGRIVAHQSHYDDYKESVSTAAAAPAAAPVSTVVPSGEGKGNGVVINVYASRKQDNV